MNREAFGTYWTKKMSDIFPSYEDFKDCYDNDIPSVMKTYTIVPEGQSTSVEKSYVSDTGLELTYYLLISNYTNSPISNMDQNQFKFRLFACIMQYGPIWEKRMEIQKKLRTLTSEQIKSGSKAIYNYSRNDGTPVDNLEEELTRLNDQNTTNYKKAPIEAYGQLYEIIGEDVTKAYIDKFKKLFLQVATPQMPLLYETDIKEDDL